MIHFWMDDINFLNLFRWYSLTNGWRSTGRGMNTYCVLIRMYAVFLCHHICLLSIPLLLYFQRFRIFRGSWWVRLCQRIEGEVRIIPDILLTTGQLLNVWCMILQCFKCFFLMFTIFLNGGKISVKFSRQYLNIMVVCVGAQRNHLYYEMLRLKFW